MDSSATIAHNDQPECYHITLKNRLDELETLSNWLNQLSDELQLSARSVFRLELVLAEAVTNIIQYAYEGEAEHDITISLYCINRTIHINVRDDGQPFDPLQQPEVVLPTSLEEATVGGLGIHLIRSYVDACNYQRDSNQNLLTIVICDRV
jgi:anti-sigma regulatory factor (Ser/Thr protein kinase)